jgi:hypothetical protein
MTLLPQPWHHGRRTVPKKIAEEDLSRLTTEAIYALQVFRAAALVEKIITF